MIYLHLNLKIISNQKKNIFDFVALNNKNFFSICNKTTFQKHNYKQLNSL